MARGLTYFCWHCYRQADQPAGPCPHRGSEIRSPAEADYTDQLLWALDHPLAETRLTAVAVLANRQEERAVPALRQLAASVQDPYLAAAALEAVVRIEGEPATRQLLHRLQTGRSAPVRSTARRLLRLQEVDSDG